jgi:hypothetical protein
MRIEVRITIESTESTDAPIARGELVDIVISTPHLSELEGAADRAVQRALKAIDA